METLSCVVVVVYGRVHMDRSCQTRRQVTKWFLSCISSLLYYTWWGWGWDAKPYFHFATWLLVSIWEETWEGVSKVGSGGKVFLFNVFLCFLPMDSSSFLAPMIITPIALPSLWQWQFLCGSSRIKLAVFPTFEELTSKCLVSGKPAVFHQHFSEIWILASGPLPLRF